MNHGITVAYIGVHQAYQLALAAHEIGKLDRFYCSFLDAPGKWGHRFARLIGSDVFASHRIGGLPPEKGEEHPWPLLWHEARARVFRSRSTDWSLTNDRFDSWVAARLARSASRVFIGTETCAERSFRVARKRGMIKVLDCPGVDAAFLDELAVQSAAEFGLPSPMSSDAPAMRHRKDEEIELADAVITCSEFQVQTMRRRGIPLERLVVVPLWVDNHFWKRPPKPRQRSGSDPLEVLFAGKISVRKGVPYLLQVAGSCPSEVRLTLVGPIHEEMKPLLRQVGDNVKVLAPTTKSGLRDLYLRKDVLVLPTLGDSFGFVAMEAMACGLPVIVTQNCGVPVPDKSWRVPVMNGEAIARRLEYYAEDREALKRDGEVAVQFARQFTPERYRDQIKDFFRRILGETPQPVVAADVKS
jgi:glycosyltransferase involved in cell wall biosynthesis